MPPVIFHRLVRALLSIVRFGVGLLFFHHGAEKLWGFAGARTVGVHLSLIGMAGPIEGAGRILIVLAPVHSSRGIHSLWREGCGLFYTG